MKQSTLINSWCLAKPQAASSSSAADNPVVIIDDEDEDEAFLVEAMDAASNVAQSSTTMEAPITERKPESPNVKDLEKRLQPLRCPYRPTVNDSVHIEGFDLESGLNWVYPTNMSVRDYQLNIVQEALFKNTLVCLPTGLGKTFIAAVVMFNFYRWYPNSKIVFMAPTRPLVAQQMDACFNIMGISQDSTIEMTGTLMPNVRRREWINRRIVFLTPQVLVNDVQSNACPVNLIKCIVIDEAHKASGNHAYCQVIREISAKCSQFRVLALTATPGSDIKSVQDVIHNLLISHIELRTEECRDIKMYSFERTVEKIIVPLGHELSEIKNLYYRLLDVLVQKLRYLRALGPRNTVGSLSKFALVKQQELLKKNGFVGINQLNVSAIYKYFGLAISLYHGYELLQQHGLRPLFSYLDGILKGQRSHANVRMELRNMPEFMAVWECLEKRYRSDPNASISDVLSTQRDFVSGHPKLDKLREIVLEHFQSMRNSDRSNSSVIIFSQFRDSVAEILHMLKKQGPLVKPISFIGQNSGRSAKTKGYTQKDQLRIMKEFREGLHNVLISTCVGEEGLDIGEVDLIVCFDSAASPVRLIQRMGRTGRKRTGRIVMLLTEGKEVSSYNTSLSKKRNIHKAIFDGVRQLQFYPKNPRMVPLDLKPQVEFKRMDILKKTTPAERKRKSEKGKENRSQKSIKNMLKKQSPQKLFLSTQIRRCFQESRSLVSSHIGGVCLERAPFLSLKKGQDREEASYSFPNKYLRFNQRLQDSCMIGHGSVTRGCVSVMQLLKESRRGRTSLVYHALGLREMNVEETGGHLSRSELDFSSGEEDFALSKSRRHGCTEAPDLIVLKDSDEGDSVGSEVPAGSCSPVFGACTQAPAKEENVDEFDEDLTREEFYSKALRHVTSAPTLDFLDDLVGDLKSNADTLSGPPLTIADLNAAMFPELNFWGFDDQEDEEAIFPEGLSSNHDIASENSEEEMLDNCMQLSEVLPTDMTSGSILKSRNDKDMGPFAIENKKKDNSVSFVNSTSSSKVKEKSLPEPRVQQSIARRHSALLSCFQTPKSRIIKPSNHSSRLTMTQAMDFLEMSSFDFDLSLSGFDYDLQTGLQTAEQNSRKRDCKRDLSSFACNATIQKNKTLPGTQCNFDLGLDFDCDVSNTRKKHSLEPKRNQTPIETQCNFDLGLDFDCDISITRKKHSLEPKQSEPLLKTQCNFDLGLDFDFGTSNKQTNDAADNLDLNGDCRSETKPHEVTDTDFNWLLGSFDSSTIRASSPKHEAVHASVKKNSLVENFSRPVSVARASPFKLDLMDKKGIVRRSENDMRASQGNRSWTEASTSKRSFLEESSYFVSRPKKHRAFIVESEDDDEFESPPWLTKKSIGTISVKAASSNHKKLLLTSEEEVDSPIPQRKKKKKRTVDCGRQFVYSQASVEDDESECDSDSGDDDEYDSSFVDDEEDTTANSHEQSAMMAVYAASLRNREVAPHRGHFKLQYEPAVGDPAMIFSQMPEQDDSYERDSFCVSEVDTPESKTVRKKKSKRKRKMDDDDDGAVLKKVKRLRLVEEESPLSDLSDFK